MHCIGKGALAALVLGGIGACSDVTDGMPTAQTQQEAPQPQIPSSYVANADMVIAEPAAGFGTVLVCDVHDAIPGGASRRSCLMKFPISGGNTITITEASLDLRVTDASSQAINVYPLLKSWSETTGTWTHASTGNPWQVPGAKGALDRGPSIGAPVFGQTGDAVFHFNATGRQMVQSWFDNPDGNNKGIIFEQVSSDRVQFATREDATPQFRPTLNINFVEEGTAGTGGNGGRSGVGGGGGMAGGPGVGGTGASGSEGDSG